MGEVFISGKGVVEIYDNVMAGECTVLPSYMVVCMWWWIPLET